MQTPPNVDAESALLLEEEDALVDTLLGNYRLLDRIGVGATALVYRAEHVQLGRIYAVKILHPSIAIRPGMRERFLREAKTAGQLNHENIIFIADFAIDPQLGPYMVMEFLEGENLQEVLEREESLSIPRLKEISAQVCKALSVAHEAGIIHRDLKPENIYLVPRPDGTDMVKILDFGIARLVQSTASLTGDGKLLGTPLYMSPEQCRGNSELTPASDLYSFGVVLFEMLTGRTPFTGDNPQKLLIDHFLVDPPELPSHFPESLRAIQAELLAKSPQDRPPHIDVVHQRLLAALDEVGRFVVPPSFPTEAAFTHEQLPALSEETGEILSEYDIIDGQDGPTGTNYTAQTAAFSHHESTLENSYAPTSSHRASSGREEYSTQEQLPAASTPLPLTTPSPSSLLSHLSKASSSDSVRQSPRWGDELATAAWDAVPQEEQDALLRQHAPRAPSPAPSLGPKANLLDISLIDPSRMTLQGSELSTNDVLTIAQQQQQQQQHVVIKQRSAQTDGQHQDALLSDLEHLFNNQNDAAHPEAPFAPPNPLLDADEELLKDLNQSLTPVPPTGGWTQGYEMPTPVWQSDEPVIELRKKKSPPSIHVELGTNAAPNAMVTPPPTVRVEKGNKSQPPIATNRETRLPDSMMRTELDLSLGDAYPIDSQLGQNLDLEELLQLPTQREDSPLLESKSAASMHSPTIEEASQPNMEGVSLVLASQNSPAIKHPSQPQLHAVPGSQPVQLNARAFDLDLSRQIDQNIFHPKEGPRTNPTWIVLLFVSLAALAGILVYWLWTHQ